MCVCVCVCVCACVCVWGGGGIVVMQRSPQVTGVCPPEVMTDDLCLPVLANACGDSLCLLFAVLAKSESFEVPLGHAVYAVCQLGVVLCVYIPFE